MIFTIHIYICTSISYLHDHIHFPIACHTSDYPLSHHDKVKLVISEETEIFGETATLRNSFTNFKLFDHIIQGWDITNRIEWTKIVHLRFSLFRTSCELSYYKYIYIYKYLQIKIQRVRNHVNHYRMYISIATHQTQNDQADNLTT